MKSCSIIGCIKESWCKGWCMMHYYRNKRHGNPLYEEVFKKDSICTFPGCSKNQEAKNLCQTHYTKLRRTGTLEYERLHDGKATERNRARTAQWKKDNKKTYNAYLNTRKKRVKQATPSWADLDAIREFYFNCPEGYHVDHIIPLNGKNVSGLHTMENLQYLPALDNLKKSNKVT